MEKGKVATGNRTPTCPGSGCGPGLSLIVSPQASHFPPLGLSVLNMTCRGGRDPDHGQA